MLMTCKVAIEHRSFSHHCPLLAHASLPHPTSFRFRSTPFIMIRHSTLARVSRHIFGSRVIGVLFKDVSRVAGQAACLVVLALALLLAG